MLMSVVIIGHDLYMIFTITTAFIDDQDILVRSKFACWKMLSSLKLSRPAAILNTTTEGRAYHR